MDNLSKKQELEEEKIRQIRATLAYKADDWVLSGGQMCDGMEIFRTQDEEIFVLRDTETGIKLGMKKEIKNDGVVTHLSFFNIND